MREESVLEVESSWEQSFPQDDQPLQENGLIQAAAAGNMGAFAQLVRAYRARVLRTAYGVVGSAEEAEDVAQEVFIKIWNNLAHYQTQGTFANWLYRITINTAIDVLRRHRADAPLEEWQPDDSRNHPEECLMDRDGQEAIRKAIASLPPSARAALILREYEQLSYREIAEVLKIPLGTVMSRLSYARQTLKKSLLRPEE